MNCQIINYSNGVMVVPQKDTPVKFFKNIFELLIFLKDNNLKVTQVENLFGDVNIIVTK